MVNANTCCNPFVRDNVHKWSLKKTKFFKETKFMATEKLTPSSGNDRPIGWVSISFQGEQESVGIKLLGYQLYLLCNYFQSFQKKKKKWWIQIIILFIFFIYMPIETMGYTMRDNSLLRSRVQVKLDPNFTNKASWH